MSQRDTSKVTSLLIRFLKIVYYLYLVNSAAPAVAENPLSVRCPFDCTCGHADLNHVSVDCRYTLPKSVPQGTLSLQLKYMEESLSILSHGILNIRNSGNLSKLDIESQVTSIEGRAFEDFPELILLDLSRNLLTSLSASSFVGLGKLETLLLTGNNLTTIPENAFQPLSNLKALYLDFNFLKRIPLPLPTQLRILSLRYNLIEKVDVPLEQSHVMPRLAQVDLCENNFTSFINPPFSVDELKILCVGGNEVDIGSGILSRMTNLESLELNANLATGAEWSPGLISAMIGMKKLQAFKAENYGFGDFGFLGNLTSLRTLTLNRVPDRAVSNLIVLNSLPKLNSLYLKRSPSVATALLSTPALITALKRLKSLSLPSNGIQTLPLLAATIFKNLAVLDISQNPLRCDCTLAWVKERYDVDGIFLREHMNTHCHNNTLDQYVRLVDNAFTCPKISVGEADLVAGADTHPQGFTSSTVGGWDLDGPEIIANDTFSRRGNMTSGLNSTSSAGNSKYSVTDGMHEKPKAELQPASTSVSPLFTLSAVVSVIALTFLSTLAVLKYRKEKNKRLEKLNQTAAEMNEDAESKQVSYSRLGPGDD